MKSATTSRRLLLPSLVIGALVATGVAAWGIWGGDRGKPTASGLTFEPTGEERKAILALRSRLSPGNPSFSPEDARQRQNAKLFTYMAATSEEPLVVKASLDAIQSAYSPRSTKKAAPDADLDYVLLKHLRSEQAAIAQAAFSAARIPLLAEEPRPALIATLAQMASPNEAPARRYAALEALNLLRPALRSRAVLQAFEEALGAAEPQLVSVGLFALSQSAAALDSAGKPETLGPRVQQLTDHSDPGVRGRALSLLSELDGLSPRGELTREALEHLADAHPYVRAEAAASLGRSQEASVIHRLMTLVEDMELSRYELEGWTTLDGKPGQITHVLPGRRRVCEAALYSMLRLSEATQTPLKISIGGPRQTDESLQGNVARAKAWYESVRASIPSPH